MTRRSLLAVALVLGVGLAGSEAFSQNNVQPPKAQKKKKKRARAVQPRVRKIQIRPGAFVRRGRGANPLQLLRNPKVQDELKLDEDQKTEATEAIQELSKSRRGLYKNLQGLQPKDRQKKVREFNKKFQQDSAKKAKDILEPKQYARLQEIVVQLQGIRALQNPDVEKKLKISDEQKKKIADIQTSLPQKRQQILQGLRANGNRIDFKKYREKVQKLNKEIEKNTLEVLTKEQREQFDKMKGKKFELGRGRLGGIRGGIRIQPIPAGKIRIRRIQGKRIQRRAIQPKKARKANKAKQDKPADN